MRRMRARDVPDELIPRLLDAAVRAPSGGGFQNWCFIVIRDRAMRASLGTLFEGDIKAARAGRYKPLEDALARGGAASRSTRTRRSSGLCCTLPPTSPRSRCS